MTTPRKILIVGSSSADRALTRGLFERRAVDEFSILEASSGTEAAALCRSEKPDCVVLDHSPPNCDGIAIARELNPDPYYPTVAVVIVTSQRGESLAVKALKNGSQNFLVKDTFTAKDLRTAVLEAIETVNYSRVQKAKMNRPPDGEKFKRLPENLSLSDERLALAMQGSDIGAFDWNIKTGEIQWSHKTEESAAMSADEFNNSFEGFLKLIHPLDLETFRERIDAAFRDGDYECEFRMLKGDGTIRWVIGKGRVFYDEAGEPARLVGVDIDITKRKQAEEELAERQCFTQSIVDSVPSVLYLFDLESKRNTYLTDQGAKSLGYSIDELRTAGSNFIVSHMHPEDAKRAQIHFNAIKQASNGETFEFEYRMRHKSGEWRWFRSSDRVFRRTNDGTPLEILGIAADITERKRAEEALRESQINLKLTTEAARIGTWQWNLKTNEVKWSPVAKRLFGYDQDNESFTHEDWTSLLHPEDLRRMEEGLPGWIGEGKDVDFEYRVTPKGTNEVRWIRSSGKIGYDEAGEPAVLRGISFDITESKRAEERLVEAEHRAVDEYRQLISRIAPLAHSLGTTDDLAVVYRELLNFLRPEMPCDGFFISFYSAELDERTAAFAWAKDIGEIDISMLPPMGLAGKSGPNARAVRDGKTILTDDYDDLVKANPHFVVIGEDDGTRPATSAVAPMIVADKVIGTIEVQSYQKAAYSPEKLVALEMAANLAAIAVENVRSRDDLRESERQLRLSLEASSAGSWSWDIAANVSTWDDLYHTLYGFAPDEPRSVDSWLERVHPDDRIRLRDRIADMLETAGEDVWNQEFRVMHPTKGERWMCGLGRVERDARGRALRFFGINLDITERKDAEEMLRESEERLHLGIQVAAFAICEINYETGINHLSKEAARLYGLGDEEMSVPRETVHATFHPDDREKLSKLIEKALSGNDGGWFALEHRIVLKNGDVRWLNVRKQIFFDGKKPTIGILAAQDITERKHAEEKLREQQAFTQNIIEAAPSLTYIFDINASRNIFISPQALNVLGYAPEEIEQMGERVLEILLHPDDVSPASERFARILSDNDDETYELEYRMRHKSGEYVWLFDRARVFQRAQDGTPTHVLGVTSDITERKEAELAHAQLSAIVASSADAIYIYDFDGIVLSWNRSAEEIYGYAAEEIIGSSVTVLFPPDRLTEAFEVIIPSIKRGESLVNMETVRLRRDGSFFDALLTASPVRDDDGQPVAVSLNARDITERKEAEEKLRIAIERNEVAQEAAHATLYEYIPQTDEVIGNAALMNVLGFAPCELPVTGAAWQKLMHPDDLARTWETIGKGIESGTGFELEYRVCHKDGHYVWLYDRARVLRDEKGNPERVVGMILDITQRKAAEEANRKRNEQLDLLARVSQLLILENKSEPELLEAVFSAVSRTIGAEMYFNYQPDDEVSMRLNTWGGLTDDERELFDTMRFGELLCGRVAVRRKPIIVEDIANTEIEGSEAVRAAGYGAYAGFPLVAGDRLLGTIAFVKRSEKHFAEGEIQLIQTVCDQIAATLERARLTRELTESEENFRTASDAAAAEVYNVDLTGKRKTIAYGLERVTGYTNEEAPLTSDWWHSLIHPDDLPAHLESLERQLESGDTYRATHRLRRKTGEWIWVEDTGRIIRDETGKAVQMVGAVVDITSRKDAEDKIRESEERFRLASDAAAALVYDVDLTGQRKVIAHGLERVTGYKNDESSLSSDWWHSLIHPEDLQAHLDNYARHLEQGGSYTTTYRVRRKNGTWIWVEDTAKVVKDDSGAAVQLVGTIVDITERKDAEEKLRYQFQLTQNITDSAAVAIFVTGANGNVSFVNPEAEKMFGYTAEEMIGQDLHYTIHYQYPDGTPFPLEECPLGNVFADGKPVRDYEGTFFRKDGVPVEMICSNMPLFENGQPAGEVMAMLDISERKRAEAAVRESEKFVRSTLNSLTPSVAILDRNGVIVDVNRAWRQFANENNWNASRCGVGLNYLDIVRQAIASGDSDAEPILSGLEAILKGRRRTFEYEYPCHSPNEQRWFILNASPLATEQGGAVISHINITDRKLAEERIRESEERHRMALEGAELGSWDVDLRTGVAVWNRRHAEMQGYPPDIGPTNLEQWLDLVHPDDIERVMDDIETARRTGETLTLEHRLLRPDTGELRWLSLYGRFSYSEEGEVVRFSGVSLDITDRKHAEQTLRQRELLESVVKFQEAERQRIARDIHDHLGQQLTGLRLTLADLLESSTDVPRLREKVEKAQSSAQLLDKDVSLLAFELRANVLSEQSLADALENFVTEWSRNYQIHAEFHAVSPAARRRLPDDFETHLYRIAQEALNNIGKHAKATNVGVILEIRDNEIRLIIEDDGVGFDPDAKRKAPQKSGHGMGLIGMKERVDLLGGNLEIDSEPGSGTTVFVTVPAPQQGTALTAGR